MATEVEKLLNEVMKLEKVIKKAVTELKKKPGDAKIAADVRKGMLEIKKLEAAYPKAAAADEKYFKDAIKQITG